MRGSQRGGEGKWQSQQQGGRENSYMLGAEPSAEEESMDKYD